MTRRHSLAVTIKTDPREDLMQVLRIEIMKTEKMRRALKIEELKEVVTIMIVDPLVPKVFQVWKNGPLCTRLSIQVENSLRKYSDVQQPRR